MLGVYDYTVILTYLSVISAILGTVISMTDGGHPYTGILFLLLCGLCDGFDGKVARTKKNRSEYEKKFGIQIDSLTDILAFGMLPAAVGCSLMNSAKPGFNTEMIMFAVLTFYVLAALIRLAHFNVTEEERQKKETGTRMYYEGLPVTFSSLVFPSILLFQFVTEKNLVFLYFSALLIMGVLFISKFRIRKPQKYGIAAIAVVCVLEVAVLCAKVLG